MAKTEKFGVDIVGKETVSKAAASAEKGLAGLTKRMGLAVAAGNILANVITSIGRGLVGLGKKAIELALSFEGIEHGFRKLADNSDQLLGKLKTATRGTITEIDLMRQANQALLLGIDQEALPNMFKGAAIIAQATGDDITFALNSITAGIGRQSRMLLDNLGIVVKAEEAYRNYAKEINSTVSQLTQVQRTTAFTEAAIKALNERVGKLGGELLPTAQNELNELKKTFSELGTEIGSGFLPILEGAASFLNNLLTRFNVMMDESAVSALKLKLSLEAVFTKKTWEEAKTEMEILDKMLDERIKKWFGMTEAVEKNTESVEKNTKAQEEQNNVIKTTLDLHKELMDSLQGLSDLERARALDFRGDIGGGRKAAVWNKHTGSWTSPDQAAADEAANEDSTV